MPGKLDARPTLSVRLGSTGSKARPPTDTPCSFRFVATRSKLGGRATHLARLGFSGTSSNLGAKAKPAYDARLLDLRVRAGTELAGHSRRPTEHPEKQWDVALAPIARATGTREVGPFGYPAAGHRLDVIDLLVWSAAVGAGVVFEKCHRARPSVSSRDGYTRSPNSIPGSTASARPTSSNRLPPNLCPSYSVPRTRGP